MPSCPLGQCRDPPPLHCASGSPNPVTVLGMDPQLCLTPLSLQMSLAGTETLGLLGLWPGYATHWMLLGARGWGVSPRALGSAVRLGSPQIGLSQSLHGSVGGSQVGEQSFCLWVGGGLSRCYHQPALGWFLALGFRGSPSTSSPHRMCLVLGLFTMSPTSSVPVISGMDCYCCLLSMGSRLTA